jgi:uncharacterized iron-regulated membrane protein
MRKLFFNLHLYAALVAGLFIVILGITGSILAFEQELDQLLHPKLNRVTPQPHKLSLAEISAAVLKALPDAQISGYSLSSAPDTAYQVGTNRGLVYVNQYTGEILGVQQGPDSISNALNFVHQVHLRLAIRNRADTGKEIIKWVGVVILFMLLSGLYLWWPVKRVGIRKGAAGRRFWFDLHNAVGIFSLVFLLTLALTGIVIGFEDATTPMLYQLTGTQPRLVYNRTRPPAITPPPDAQPITPDQAVELARTALPGAEPFQLNVPGPKDNYLIRARFPEDRTSGGRSQVLVDQYSGKVLIAESSRTAPAGSRLITANRAIHTGDIFGMLSKTVMSLASLMLVAQMLSGILMWWKRERKKQPVSSKSA